MERNMSSGEKVESGDRLDALFREYRAANADFEPGVNFMPGMWQRIEARRGSSLLVRRWAEVCLLATVALAVLLSVFVLPSVQRASIYQSTYVDTLAAADTMTDFALVSFLETPGETE